MNPPETFQSEGLSPPPLFKHIKLALARGVDVYMYRAVKSSTNDYIDAHIHIGSMVLSSIIIAFFLDIAVSLVF